MNACFLEKSWPVIDSNVTDPILNFFDTLSMPAVVNCTSVTLIPKVQYSTSIREYKPISCCCVLQILFQNFDQEAANYDG